MRLLLFLYFFLFTWAIQAQTPVLIASQEATTAGGTVTVYVTVDSLQSAVSMQLTLSWDSDILTYQSTGDYGLTSLSEFNFGETQVATGILTFVWFDGQVGGVTLADGSTLFSVTFTAIGEVGELSDISFVNTPTPIQIGVIDGTDINEIPHLSVNGQVQIITNNVILESDIIPIDCFDAATGSIDLEIEGGLSPYEYSWEGPNDFTSNESNLDNLPAGEYSITVNDQVGNTTSETYTVTQTATIQIDELLINTTDCNQPTGSVTLSVSGGTPDYSYDYGDGFISEATQMNLAAGSFTVLIQDAANCQIDTLIEIIETNGPNVNLGEDSSICSDGEFLLSAGTDNTLTYEWLQNGSSLTETMAELTVTEAATYEVLATNVQGCTASDTIQISEIAAPIIDLGQDTSLCANESLLLSATAGLSYEWFLNDTPLSQTTATITVSEIGTYTLIGTNAATCSSSDTVIVNQAVLPMLSVSPDTSICLGSSLLLNADSDALTFQWSLNGDLLTETESQLSIDQTGNYLVEVSNEEGCLNSAEIIVNPALEAQADLGDDIAICPDTETTLSVPANALSYQWSFNEELLNTTTAELSTQEIGTYSVTITSTQACIASDTIQISEIAAPIIDLGQDTSLCANESLLLSATAGLSYEWFLNDTPLGQTTATITVSEIGTYTLIGTNAATCSSSDTVIVNQAVLPMLSVSPDTSICVGSSLLLNADSDALTFQWSLNGDLLTETESQLSIDQTGNYLVEVSNEEGCLNSAEIIVNPALEAQADLGDDIAICPDTETTLSVPANALSYQWSFNEELLNTTTAELSTQEIGTYSVTVTSTQACIASDTIQINAASSAVIDLGPDVEVCPKIATSLLADMGFASYEWFFNDTPFGENDAEVEVSEQGTYTIIAIDNNGCIAMDTLLLMELNIVTTAGPDTIITLGDSVQLFATGGVTYEWMADLELSCYDCPNPIATPSETTTFQLMITSEEGCISEEFFTIEVDEKSELLVDLVNFLSPNGDGKNDILIFAGLENYQTSQLSIFNRWGDLLFNKLNYQGDGIYWDATFKGEPLPAGIYYYVLRLDQETDIIRSSLTIVRD